MAAPKQCCFVARLTDLEPEQETRIKAWGNPRCREFRVLPPVGGVSVVCGILVTQPATARGFQSLWITNIKKWQIPPGPAYRPGKLRLVTLDDYRAEMGTSTVAVETCASIVDAILSRVFSTMELKASSEAEIARQNRETREVIDRNCKRLRDEAADDEAHRVRIRKKDAFWDSRRRLGDDLDGNVRPTPPFDRHATVCWWVSDRELQEADDWEDVLIHRSAERRRELGLPELPPLVFD